MLSRIQTIAFKLTAGPRLAMEQLISFKAHFRRFLDGRPGLLHFAAHSHHLWPDVSFEAHQRAWEFASTRWDEKWDGEDNLFRQVLADVQRRIAKLLSLRDHSTLALGTNTHEFLNRLLSCGDWRRPARVLSTDGEFHSFRRQVERLKEDGALIEDCVPVRPFETFCERFLEKVRAGGHDLVFVSQVFFDSGAVFERMDELPDAIPDQDTIIVLDGYHGFCALPTDLSRIQERVFYLAGGYKYAMAGEGACFLHCPPGHGSRPRDTGWYAGFGSLEAHQSEPSYSRDGSRFMGATFDPTGFFRMQATLELLDELRLTPDIIHKRAVALQEQFLAGLPAAGVHGIQVETLVPPASAKRRGNFLTFETSRAGMLRDALRERLVVTDRRDQRLRFGFGIYQDPQDVEELLRRMRGL